MMAFIKNWMLPLAMLAGALGYFVYAGIPALDSTHQMANRTIAVVQPLLLFAMLFLTFCKVRPADLRLARWQAGVLSSTASSLPHPSPAAIWCPGSSRRAAW